MAISDIQMNPEWLSAVGAWIIPVALGFFAYRQGSIAREQDRRRDDRHRDDRVLDWASRVLVAFAELEVGCRNRTPTEDVSERASQIAARASALIDEGRFFFPNVDTTKQRFVFDRDNDGRAGLRQRVLDDVVRLYIVASSIQSESANCCADAAAVLWRTRQSFVEQVQTQTLSTLQMRTPSLAAAESAGSGISSDWRSWD